MKVDKEYIREHMHLSDKELAEKFNCSPGTIRNHKTAIKKHELFNAQSKSAQARELTKRGVDKDTIQQITGLDNSSLIHAIEAVERDKALIEKYEEKEDSLLADTRGRILVALQEAAPKMVSQIENTRQFLDYTKAYGILRDKKPNNINILANFGTMLGQVDKLIAQEIKTANTADEDTTVEAEYSCV